MNAIKLLEEARKTIDELSPMTNVEAVARRVTLARIDALLKTGGWIAVTPETMPPEEFKDVLVLRSGKISDGSWYKHNDGTVCWSISGHTGHPHLVAPPEYWQPLPPLPEAK